jgi:hypothetical protein
MAQDTRTNRRFSLKTLLMLVGALTMLAGIAVPAFIHYVPSTSVKIDAPANARKKAIPVFIQTGSGSTGNEADAATDSTP